MALYKDMHPEDPAETRGLHVFGRVLNVNCSSYSCCFLSFCSCSLSYRDRGSYTSSGHSERKRKGVGRDTHFIMLSYYFGITKDFKGQVKSLHDLRTRVTQK